MQRVLEKPAVCRTSTGRRKFAPAWPASSQANFRRVSRTSDKALPVRLIRGKSCVSSRQTRQALKRDVVVLLPGRLFLLIAQHVERAGDAVARAARLNHLVDIAALGRDERIAEAVLILLDARGDLVLIGKLGAVQDFRRSL
jgi:hypothetical protein